MKNITNFYLFSLNPNLLYESDEEMINSFNNDISLLKNKKQVRYHWSVQSYKMIDINDIALFISLGSKNKTSNGLFGYGTILKPTLDDIKHIRNFENTKSAKMDPSGNTITAEHWQYAKQDQLAHYCVIDVKCLSIPSQPIISMSELESDDKLKMEKWSIRGTGYPIKNNISALTAYNRLKQYLISNLLNLK